MRLVTDYDRPSLPSQGKFHVAKGLVCGQDQFGSTQPVVPQQTADIEFEMGFDSFPG